MLVAWVANGSVAVLSWRAPDNATDDVVADSVQMTAATFLTGDLSNARVNNATADPFQQALRGSHSTAGIEGVRLKLVSLLSRPGHLHGYLLAIAASKCFFRSLSGRCRVTLQTLYTGDAFVSCICTTIQVKLLLYCPLMFSMPSLEATLLAGNCKHLGGCTPQEGAVHGSRGWGIICHPGCRLGCNQLSTSSNSPHHIWSTSCMFYVYLVGRVHASC